MKRPTIYEPIACKTVLNSVKAQSMPFHWSINPYRGCQHGCSFCYARATHTFLGVEADDTFQHHIFFKSDAPAALREQLRKADRSRGGIASLGLVAIGTATDPYQPIEGKELLTRGCLEALAEYDVPISITTRSPLVLRDMELLRRFSSVTVNISVNTLNEQVWRALEPATSFPRKRLETVAKLNEAGIQAGIFLAPIVPYLTDGTSTLSQLIEEAARCHPAFVMPSFLRLTHREVKIWFFHTIEMSFPHLLPRFAELYRSSGYAPVTYREPVRDSVRRLLERFGLAGMEPFRGRQATEERAADPVAENSGKPEQLSFSF